MTRKERDAEVSRLASASGLSTGQGIGNNTWLISRGGDHLGILAYNQRHGGWKAVGSKLSRAHFGGLAELLAVFAAVPPPGKPLIEVLD